MKRPLFAACLIFVGIVAIYYQINPPSLPERVPARRESVLLYGQVERKERRISYGKEQYILYLSDVSQVDAESDNLNFNDSMAAGSVSTGSTNLNFNFKSNQLFQKFFQTIPQGESGVICYTDSAQWEPRVGSFILVHGKARDFERARNEGAFDSRLYYATLGIGFSVREAEILWESENYSKWKETLWNIRCKAGDKVDEVLDERNSSVLKTMLLGEKSSLDKEIKELYQDNGIAHILAISGLHISVLGVGLYNTMRRAGLPIWMCAAICGLVIAIYGVMTGAGVSAFRAAGMFLLRMTAELLGRSYDMLTSLGVLLVAMVCRQPLYLYHSGFLLSFASLFGIGLLYASLEEGRKRRAVYREGIFAFLYAVGDGVRKGFWSGASVVLATMPVTFWYFYELPVYGVVINLAVIPLMTVLMYLGMSLLILPVCIGRIIPSALIELILDFYCVLCELSEGLPGHMWIRGRPEKWQIVFNISLLGLIVLGKRRISRGFRLLLLGVAVFVLGMQVPCETKISFLDVGQGDCICVQVESGGTYLVDAGSSSESDVGKYTIATYLKCQGVSELAAVIITHPDADHCNGLAGLLEEGYAGRVQRLLLPDIAPESKDVSYLELEALAGQYEIPVGYLSCGMYWQDGEMTFLSLHPPENYGDVGASESISAGPSESVSAGTSESVSAGTSEAIHEVSTNEYSQVLYLKTKSISVLLTGDVEGEGEEMLMDELRKYGIRDVSILKVAHHGSRYSTGQEFLSIVRPRIAVISCGEGNAYGHPHEELLMRLENSGAVILTTPEYGGITLEGEKLYFGAEE